MPFCHFEVLVAKPKLERYPKELNTLGDHIRARRIDLGLFQSRVAEQIGVNETTITNWEGNESQPSVRYIPAIIEFLGQNPMKGTGSFPEQLITARHVQGLSQRKMALRLGVDPATIQGWESGQHRPTPRRLAQVTKAIESL